MKDLKESVEYEIVWLVRRLFRAMGSYAGSYLEELGISAAERAVMEFLSLGNKLSVPGIAEKYQVSRQHIQMNVNSLQDKGLVTTENNPKHRRSPLIKLTAKGEKLFEQISEKDLDAVSLMFRDVAVSDCKVCVRTLKSMLSNITQGD